MGLAALPGQHGLKVFISYSRSDLEFVQQLVPALEALHYAITIDTTDVFGAELWKDRLSQMIREADTVVFVLSPASAKSEVCAWEVEQAVDYRKRIIPIVARPLDNVSPHETLKNLNYIFFYQNPCAAGSGWGAGLAGLHSTLSVDVEWIRDHTRLTGIAAQWDGQKEDFDLLLRGSELAKFQDWRDRRPSNSPELTALQRKFLEASEHAQQARNDAERQQLEKIHQSQNDREKALQEKSKAQEERAQALTLVWRRTVVGILVSLILFLGLAIATIEVIRRGQSNERALRRIEDEQLLFGRLLKLTSNREIPPESSDVYILASRYEGENVDHIGTDFVGGRYYGVYRIKAGKQMDDYLLFLRQYYNDLYKRLKLDVYKPGKAFDSSWLSLARDGVQRKKFAISQWEFIEQTSYIQLLRKLKGQSCTKPDGKLIKLDKPIQLNVAGRSRTLQQVMFSIAVQYGPETCLVHDALSSMPSLANESDSAIIKKLFEFRNRVERYFPEVEQKSRNFASLIKLRNELELRDALRLLSPS